MFDINNIINAAIAEAVNAHLTEVLQQHANIVAGLAEKIDTLEKNEGYLVKRIAALEAAPAASQSNVTIPIDEAKMVEALNDQEWFWEKMQRFAAGAAEAAMDDHTSTYDHDSYDAVVSDSDDFVKSDDLEDTVREAVGNLSFDISVS